MFKHIFDSINGLGKPFMIMIIWVPGPPVQQVIQLPGNDLTPCGRMRAEIYPVESFGNTGKPLVLDFDNPCSSPLPGLTERPQE